MSAPSPRRSCLSVPASSARKLQTAGSLGADEVVIDLEDSVAPAVKPAALAAAFEALANWVGGVAVRVNAPRTRWCHLELAALAGAGSGLRSIVVPKVSGGGDIAFLERMLDGVEAATGRERPLRIQALIETPEAIARLGEIAGGSWRVETLILGYADLGASLGRTAAGAAQPELWLAAQDAVLTAARAHGLQAIDGPYLGTADDQPFRVAAGRARDLGFDGKWAIHPSQVAALNELFTPSAEEVAHARAVVGALAAAESDGGAGAVSLEGEMLDEAVRRSALRILARAGTGDDR